MITPGVHRSRLTFPYPALAGWSWPALEIVGQRPGPRLAVMAGIHVNETSSIEAAIRLQKAITPEALAGRVSIIPIVNLPAIPERAQYVCPLDNKNINFSFPGHLEGTFAEAVAHAILSDWAADADVLVDLHGGDLCERVAHFMVVQCIGDPEFDRKALAHACCFDAELIVRLSPAHLKAAGRSCTGRALRGQHAVFAEAGRIGLIEERNVIFHLEGVMRLVQQLGMTASAPPRRRAPIIADDYLWVKAPADAFYRYRVEAGQKVGKGMVLAIGENTYGEQITEVLAPADGHILWTITHALVQTDSFIVGLAVTALERRQDQ
jgi:predicted deacylase